MEPAPDGALKDAEFKLHLLKQPCALTPQRLPTRDPDPPLAPAQLARAIRYVDFKRTALFFLESYSILMYDNIN